MPEIGRKNNEEKNYWACERNDIAIAPHIAFVEGSHTAQI